VALTATLLVWCVGAPTIAARADDCLAEPNSPAPAGSHWYYHVDKTTQRKCWYIRATEQPGQPAAAQATSDRASVPLAAPVPLEKPATASASGPMSLGAGDGTPPSPRIKVPAVKPRPAPVSGVATDQSAQQSAQKGTPQGNSASSIPEALAPQTSPSSQTSDKGTTQPSAAAPAWPDPPAAKGIAREPTAPPSDTPTESVRPTADDRASDDVKSTSQSGASISNAARTMPVEMFAIAALGLVMAGFLFRIVMKISAGRRRRVTVDRHDFDRIDEQLEHALHKDQIVHHQDARSEYLQRSKISAPIASDPRRPSRIGNDQPDITRAGDSVSHITNKTRMREHRRIDVNPRVSERSDDRPLHWGSKVQQHHQSGSIDPLEPDWADNRHQHEGRNDQQQHGSVSETDEFLCDLQSSLVAAASDYRPRPALHAVDESSDNGRKDDASQTDEIREHEEVLERLRRDLDRLLQSPKVA
jgi:hypothetical protein